MGITVNSGIQVIARAAAILRALSVEYEGLSLSQIAVRVDLPRSTVQRIIQALVTERLVVQASPSSGFRLGPAIHALASAGRIEIVDIVRPHIVALSRETGETVDLAEFRRGAMVFVDQIIGTHRLRTAATVGEIFPLTTTANGKASLALLDDDSIIALASRELAAEAEAVGTFLREINTVRQLGYAYDLDEHTEGISAVGAAFRGASAQIYAVSIPLPSPRFLASQETLAGKLRTAVNGIKQLLAS